MNEDTITVTLDGDEVLCLAQLIVARMQYLAEQPPALEVLREVEILGRYLKKTGPQVSAHAARERRERKSRWN